MRDSIIDLIFKAPEKWIHIRDAARKLGISPNTVRKGIALLKKNGIIQEKREGNLVMFRANLSDDRYKLEKRLYNIRKVYDSGIIDFIFDYYNPKAVVLFGSYSRGEDVSTSDVDLGVITSDKRMPDLSVFEKKLSRRIQLSLFTRNQVSKEFFNNIINGFVLRGFLKDE